MTINLEKLAFFVSFCLILATILARWQQPTSSVEALNLLYWAMRVAFYQRITIASKPASKLGTFFIVVLFAVTLAAAEAIWCEYTTNGVIQWLLVKLLTYDI
jgi:hypothetical protein